MAADDGAPTDQKHREKSPAFLSAEWWDKLWTDPIAVFTVFLAIIGGYQVFISQLTARRQLRAYVVSQSGGLVPQDAGKSVKYEGVFSLKNAGQTPAYKLRFEARLKLLPVPLPPDYDFRLDRKSASVITLGPGENTSCSTILEGLLTLQDEAAFHGGAGVGLYAYGFAEYWSLYRKRRTEFCWQIMWSGNTKVAPTWMSMDRNNHST